MFLKPVSVKYFVSCPYLSECNNAPFRQDDCGIWTSKPSDEPGQFHGVDIAVPHGTEVKAIANGMIISAAYQNPLKPNSGIGLRIRQLISSAGYNGWIITYGCLSETLVEPGQRVVAGDRIAYSGDTCASGSSKLCLILTDLSGQFRPIEFY